MSAIVVAVTGAMAASGVEVVVGVRQRVVSKGERRAARELSQTSAAGVEVN
jgi:hypothetical protein